MEKFKKFIKKLGSVIDYISMTPAHHYIAYMRRSQSSGSFRRQENVIRDFCSIKNLLVDEWFKETCSGLNGIKNRKIFKQVFDYCYDNEKTIILIDSTDRFCRSKKTAKDLLNLMNNTDAKIYFIKENLLVNPSSNKNVSTLIDYVKHAESEVKAYAYRMTSGRNQYIKKCREQGIRMGRPETYRKSRESYEIQYKKDIELLGDDYSLRKINSMTGTSIMTLRKLKKNVL